MAEDNQKIVIKKDGPYIVSGNVPLVDQEIGVDANGESVKWTAGDTYPEKETCGLCRCGASKNKPYCDGTHVDIGFDGTETASHDKYFDVAETITGLELDLKDYQELCAEARFCHPDGGTWNLVKESGNADEVKQQCADCPSGRYVAVGKDGKAIEPNFSPEIGLVEDSAENCAGPLWVKGGIPIESADGKEYEVRNRVTLCRCGKSENKPFCDGTHVRAGFRAKHE